MRKFLRLRYLAATLIIVSVLFIGGKILFSLDSAWRVDGPLKTERLVYFPSGIGGRAIAEKLAEHGVIDNTFLFRMLAKIHNVGGALQAGEYKFAPKASVSDVITLMQSGKTYQRRVTFPEGLTSAQMMHLMNDVEAMTGEADVPPEGSLLPETYSYSYGDSRASMVSRMQQAMDTTLAELWAGRDPNLPLASPKEAVILASVVEKETAYGAERERVAGVFFNRLKKRMPLQSDPTVIYAVTKGLGKLGRGITRSELATPSPYNTYVNAGLPPGPIANPGRAALAAVMHPETHDYFYFVADGSGGHGFSQSLKGHNAKVRNWRKIEKEQKK